MTQTYIWQMTGLIDGEYWESDLFDSIVPSSEMETIDDVRMRALMMAPMDYDIDSLTIYSVYRLTNGRLVNKECVYRISTRSLADMKTMTMAEIECESITEFINYSKID